MGQQQTEMGSAVRRMFLVLLVAALMAAMLMGSAGTAFADKGGVPDILAFNSCKASDQAGANCPAFKHVKV